jgi:hypothetical protein
LGKGYVGFGEEVLFLKLFYKSEIISKWKLLNKK